MRRLSIFTAVVAVSAFGVVALASGHANRPTRHSASGHPEVFTLFARTVQVKMIDLGDPGFSLGDETVLSDDLLTRDGGNQIGSDGVVCTVVRVADAAGGSGALQCPGTFSLRGGQIVTEGLVQLTHGQLAGTQTIAITGGTQRFRDARGEIHLQFLSSTEANITFSIDR